MESYKGFGLWWNAVRLNAKMHLYTLLLLVILHIVSFLVLTVVVYGNMTRLSLSYLLAQIMPDSYKMSLVSESGNKYVLTAAQVIDVLEPHERQYCSDLKRLFLNCVAQLTYFIQW